jgi:hypothetical protein
VVLRQDGDPPHFEGTIRTFHDDNFPMWSGHRGSAAWPPAFPDLTSCDFSIRGITNDEVYRNQAYVIQMKGKTLVEFRNLSEDSTRLQEFANDTKCALYTVASILNCFTIENGTDRLTRNVGNQHAA